MTADHARLASVLAGLSDLGFDVAVDDDPGPGWIPLADYARDPELLEAGMRLAGARFGLPEPSAMSAGWLVADVAVAVTWPAAAALLTSGVVLVGTADDVRVAHPSSGRRLAAPLKRRPRPRPGPAPAAFAHGLAAALSELVECAHVRTGRGRHALWATVTDMTAAAFHRVGDHLGRGQEARRLADQVLESASPLAGGTNWHTVTWPGGTEHTRIRNICCLWYRTPGGQLCLTCPRATDAEREAILNSRARTA